MTMCLKLCVHSLAKTNAVRDSAIALLWDLQLTRSENTTLVQGELNPAQSKAYDRLFERCHLELIAYAQQLYETSKKSIEEIYHEYCPDRLGKIPILLAQFVGQEHELVAIVTRKYLNLSRPDQSFKLS